MDLPGILMHPLFVGIVGGAGAIAVGAGLIWLGRFWFKGWRTIVDVGRFVVPHFMPPTEPGQEDNSIPAKIQRQEERTIELAEKTEENSKALVDHMHEEEKASRQRAEQRLQESRERAAELQEHRSRVDELIEGRKQDREQIAELVHGIARLRRRPFFRHNRAA